MNNLQILINIIFLGYYSIYDIKTHTIPKRATLIFLIVSLYMSNVYFIFETVSIILLIVMLENAVHLGSGDKKIVIGLSLQYGMFIGLGCLFASIVVMSAIRKAIPLIPVIYGTYIVYVCLLLSQWAVVMQWCC